MGKVRVIYRPDGDVTVIHPVRSKRPNETDDEYYEQVFTKSMQGALAGLPYDDIDKSELPPDRTDRNGWERHASGKGIHVNKAKADQKKNEEKQKLRGKKLEALGLTEADIAKIKSL